MADDKDTDWAPKSRDDWRDLFADGYKKAKTDLRAEEEEAAAKAKENENSSDNDKDGKGGGSDDSAGKNSKRKSFAERILGI